MKFDLLSAVTKVRTAMETFFNERLGEHTTVDFLPALQKDETCTNIKNTVKFTVKNKIFPMKGHSKLYEQLALIM